MKNILKIGGVLIVLILIKSCIISKEVSYTNYLKVENSSNHTLEFQFYQRQTKDDTLLTKKYFVPAKTSLFLDTAKFITKDATGRKNCHILTPDAANHCSINIGQYWEGDFHFLQIQFDSTKISPFVRLTAVNSFTASECGLFSEEFCLVAKKEQLHFKKEGIRKSSYIDKVTFIISERQYYLADSL